MRALRLTLVASLVALAAPAFGESVPTSTDEARAASARRSPPPAEVTDQAHRHAIEMMKGKDHQAAWDATHSSADGERNAERGRKHTSEMMKGKDHQSAWDATDATEE